MSENNNTNEPLDGRVENTDPSQGSEPLKNTKKKTLDEQPPTSNHAAEKTVVVSASKRALQRAASEDDAHTQQRALSAGKIFIDPDETLVNPNAAFEELSPVPTRAKSEGSVAKTNGRGAPTISPSAQDPQTPVSPIVKSRANTPKKESTEIHVGYVIRERFVVKKILGSGGMGAVYQALDLRKHEAGDNDPYIAIKVLSGDFQYHDDAFVTMQREAKKTNALAHPNIVTVYDFDKDKDLIYLTMEQLKGHPLDEIIKGKAGRSIDEKRAYSIIDQISKGLSYAHSKGIVHSDLKPANIFITDDDKVKILDFGIARAINQDSEEDSFDAGKLGALTLAYASYEMINYEEPHPSDDIYALGIIACELLLGGHPYQRKDAKKVVQQNGRPPRLHIRNPFMRRCLTKSIALRRQDRIANAGQFLRHFHRSRTILRKLVVISLLVVTLFLVNTFYISTIDTQIVPFNSLSAEQQQQFRALIKEGNTALMFNDLQGAVMNFNDAYLIHTTHKDMKQAQKTIVQIMEERLSRAPEQDVEFIKEQMRALEEYPAFRSENIKLNK